MAHVGLDAIDPDTLVGELGIGHQQGVEIARNLIDDCRVLILDEPTRGIDVGAKFDVYGLMGALAREGRACRGVEQPA